MTEAFTDADLKRLKEDVIDRKRTSYETASRMMIEEIEALLARLSAVEAIERNHFVDCDCRCEGLDDLRKAWKASKGL